jgi:type II secretory pathway pseudopilin PulG
VGRDTDSFVTGLRSALREDPDVLMVGEIRDVASAEIVLNMAETGHLVLTTLHTSDTAQAIDRMVGMFGPSQQAQIGLQLASCLAGVVYQRMLPRIGGGQVVAFEILQPTSAVRSLISENKTRQLRNAIVTGRREGMQTLEDNLSDLVSAGVVSYEEAVSRSLIPKDIEDRRRNAGDTLVELIMTVAIMAIAFVSIIGGIATAISDSRVHHDQTDVQAALTTAAEVVKSVAYTFCGAGDPAGSGPASLNYQSGLSGYLLDHPLVQGDIANPTVRSVTADSAGSTACPVNGNDLELVTITDSSNDGKITNSIQVVRAQR